MHPFLIIHFKWISNLKPYLCICLAHQFLNFEL